jgi:hypothetical protein
VQQCARTKSPLFDHLVGALLQNPSHVEAKHLGGDEDLCGLRQNASAYVGLGFRSPIIRFPMSDLPPQWVGNSAAGKSAAERRGRSRGSGW